MPFTPGVYTWVTDEKSTPTGSFTKLAAQAVVSVTSADGAGTITTPTAYVAGGSSGNTITFTYKAAKAGLVDGAVRLVVPSEWSLPSASGSDPGYTTASAGTLSTSGQALTVSGVTLAAGQTLTIVYGSKASLGPGASAPASGSGQTWLTQERSTSSGTFLNLAVSPQITVLSTDGSGTMDSSPTSAVHSTVGYTITFTYTAASGGLRKGVSASQCPSAGARPPRTASPPGTRPRARARCRCPGSGSPSTG